LRSYYSRTNLARNCLLRGADIGLFFRKINVMCQRNPHSPRHDHPCIIEEIVCV
jgi:hypothetical protein